MISIPGYNIKEVVTRNASTVLLRAEKLDQGNCVLLKFPISDKLNVSVVKNLNNEFNIRSYFDSPVVLRVYEKCSVATIVFLELEHFNGVSLDAFLQQRKLSLRDSLHVATQLSCILEMLHAHSVIHSDIRPHNFLINTDTLTVALHDLGFAYKLTNKPNKTSIEDKWATALAYMSPEQSGRMEVEEDIRSDLYSLGVTFYQLLTGHLPFDQQDINELVHAHLAKQPVPPVALDSTLPLAVSDIVMKLLQKKPDERYQSARALKFDLKQCCNQLLTYRQIYAFQPCSSELSDVFKFPNCLYGREDEIKKLVEAFQSVQLRGEFILLSGNSGIGKTALVQEVYRRIQKKSMMFLSGKCDQSNRNVPFGVFVQAFKSLMSTSRNDDRIVSGIASRKGSIKQALGSSVQSLSVIIPDIKTLLDGEDIVSELTPVEAQKSLSVAFLNFLEVLATPEQPLLLFLDDLQWADTATLDILQVLMGSTNAKNIMVIGAYRDTDTHTNDFFQAVLNKVENDADVKHIHLSPLTLDNTSELLADTLGSYTTLTRALAKHLLAGTLGNPLFLYESIYRLYKNGLFTFNKQQRKWDWSLERIIEHLGPTSSVQLLTEKILRLPKTTQQTIIYAACIGQSFDLFMLAALLDKTDHEVADELKVALNENLLQVVYKPVDESTKHHLPKTTYKFFHDQVQQVASSLVSASERQEIHLSIGYFLLEKLSPEELANRIFEITNHFNIAKDLVEEHGERSKLATLNLDAGKKAMQATAYRTAHEYFQTGLTLLNSSSWTTDYDLCFSLHMNCAKTAYLNHEFTTSDRLADAMLQQLRTTTEKVMVHQVKIQSLIFQQKNKEAVLLALNVLTSLGIKFPSSYSTPALLLTYARTKWRMRGRNIKDLANLSEMREANAKRAMQIIHNITASAYHVMPAIYPYLIMKMISLSIKHGNTRESPLAYATYGAIVNGIETNNRACYEFGIMAIKLLDQFEDVSIRGRTLLIYNLINRLSRNHIHASLEDLKKCYRRGIELGDIEYAIYTSNAYCTLLCISGKNLSWVKDEMIACNTLPHALNQVESTNNNEALIQYVSNLLNENHNAVNLNGEYFNESLGFPAIIKACQPSKLFTCYVLKMNLCYLLNDYAEGSRNINKALTYIDSSRGLVLEPVFYFYASLLSFEEYKQSREKKKLNAGLFYKRKLKKWADQVPVNYLHRFFLTEAEYQCIKGKHDKAVELYDKAIKQAQENNYLQDEALAHERVARYWSMRGQKNMAKIYITSAIDAYSRWGCVLKVKQLENYNRAYSFVTQHEFEHNEVLQRASNTAPSLDLATILKASTALSSEVVFVKLLEKLMKFVIENAGAQAGYFIIDWGGKLFIEARQSVTDEKSVKLKIPLEETELIPATIVEHVFRYKKDVVLHDARLDNPFSSDRIIIANKVRSVLCIPALNQGKLVGVLYLENNLISGAFTRDRVELLKLLSGQIAVSIENSILYENLEQKVQERTAEIQVQKEEIERQKQLVEEKSKFKEQFFANMSHEIRTPMTAIIGMSELIFDTPLNDKQLEYAKGIKYSSENLLAIINDILDYAKIEAGKFSFVNKPFQLRERITRLSYIVRLMAEEKGIEFNTSIDPAIPQQLIGDPLRLHQILLNLVSNAIKFTEKGSVSINIKQRSSDENTVKLSFTVQDTGIGIAEEKLNFIFETFSRIEEELNVQYTGTGLGLFIAKKLVEEQGGSMDVTSKLKEGTSFHFTLTFQRAHVSKLDDDENMQDISLSGTKVLLVEDTLFNQVVAEEILKKIISEPVVVVAENGKVALDKLHEQAFDIILMDIKMPVMDGYTASKEIRLRKGFEAVPILAFTSNANPGEAEKCKAAGMNDYITKPIETKKLKHKIGKLLQQNEHPFKVS